MWLFYTNRVWLWNRRYRAWDPGLSSSVFVTGAATVWDRRTSHGHGMAWPIRGRRRMEHRWWSWKVPAFRGAPQERACYSVTKKQNLRDAGTKILAIGTNMYKPCSKLIWVSSTSILSAGRLPINHQPSTIHFLMPRSAVIGNSPFALLVHLEGVKHFKASALFGVGQTLLPQAQDSISAA